MKTLQELLEKYKDQKPKDFGLAMERSYPISAVLDIAHEYANQKAEQAVTAALNKVCEKGKVKKTVAYARIQKIDVKTSMCFLDSCSGIVQTISVDPDSILSLKDEILEELKAGCTCSTPFKDCSNAVQAPHGDKWYCQLHTK